MIKEGNSASIQCDEKDFAVYLAKKGDKWLTTGDPDVTMLRNGEVPTGITDIMKKKESKMDPMYRIGNSAFKFPVEDDAGEAEIHVLVAVPGIELPAIGYNKKPHPTRKRRWDRLNEILHTNKKAKIKNDESSMVYSDVSFEVVDKIMPVDHYKQSLKAIKDDKIDVMYSYLLIVTKAFGEVVTGTKAKRLHFIAPVLACVFALFDGDGQMLAEEGIVGERVHGDGKFEFVIKRGSKCLNIVVTKENNMAQGLAQAYVGSEILSDFEGLSTVYSIVTNFTDWYFCRVTDDGVERDFSTL